MHLNDEEIKERMVEITKDDFNDLLKNNFYYRKCMLACPRCKIYNHFWLVKKANTSDVMKEINPCLVELGNEFYIRKDYM